MPVSDAVIEKLLAALERQAERNDGIVEQLRLQNQQLMEQTKILAEALVQCQNDIKQLKKQQTSGPNATNFSPENVVEYLVEYEREKSDQLEKKNNFVIYGLPEKEADDSAQAIADKKVIDNIIEKSGVDLGSVITNSFRMGKKSEKFPRLVKVQTNSYSAKQKIMKEQKEVIKTVVEFDAGKGLYSQYFRDDLTRKQQAKHAALVQERNEKNEKDGYTKESPDRWKIFNWKVSQHKKN